MWSVASLQLPNVFGKFGLVLVFGALDGFCVVSESCLEFVGCNPNVCFRFVIVSCCNFGFVYHIGLKTVALYWAVIAVSAIAEA